MALEDFVEPEVGVAVALTALVASPKVRNVLRRGAVYGLAGLLMAGDAASSLAQGVKRGVRQAVPTEGADAEPTAAQEIAADETPDVPAAPKRARKAAEATSHE